jgi:endonuclease
MQRFNVVIAREDGGVEVFPMKAWLREHPEHVPPGLSPTESTSHALRNGLKKRGWQVQESAGEVRMLMPGAGLSAQITSVLGDTDEEEPAAPDPVAFDLEAQLRDFLAANLNKVSINGKSVRLFQAPDGRTGVEFPTGVGPIDILGVEESGGLVIFELKIDRGPDRVAGQLARYMGWVKKHLAEGRPVSGVIVARNIDEKLRYAASVIPSVALLEYEVEFKLRDASLGAS